MQGRDLRVKRTREFFIAAAADIVRKDGISQLSIRNVSARAGYNSATLYQYFKNLNHLAASMNEVFERELISFTERRIRRKKPENPLVRWALTYEALALYLIANPHVFESLYVFCREKDGEPSDAGEKKNDRLTEYIKANLSNISKSTGYAIGRLLEIHRVCLALTIGSLLLASGTNKTESERTADMILHQVLLTLSANLEEGR